jgi:hypothetical protein
MSRWLTFPAIFSALLAGSGAAAAAGPDSAAAGVKWRCWYDQEVHITCLIDTLSDAAMIATLPAPIPAIAEEIRREHGPGRKFYIHIPLHTRPRNTDLTAQLARTSVCGAGPECSVEFSMQPPSEDEMHGLLARELPVADADATLEDSLSDALPPLD